MIGTQHPNEVQAQLVVAERGARRRDQKELIGDCPHLALVFRWHEHGVPEVESSIRSDGFVSYRAQEQQDDEIAAGYGHRAIIIEHGQSSRVVGGKRVNSLDDMAQIAGG